MSPAPAFTTLHTFFNTEKQKKQTRYIIRTFYYPDTTENKESAIDYEIACTTEISLNYTYLTYNYYSTLFDANCFIFPFFLINGSSVCIKSLNALSDPGSFRHGPRRVEKKVAIMDVLVDGVLEVGANLPPSKNSVDLCFLF